VNTQRCNKISVLLLGDAVEVCSGTYPMFNGRSVFEIIDTSGAIPQREIIKRPRGWVQPTVDAILGCVTLPLITGIAMLDA
jgi:hypothetical protein